MSDVCLSWSPYPSDRVETSDVHRIPPTSSSLNFSPLSPPSSPTDSIQYVLGSRLRVYHSSNGNRTFESLGDFRIWSSPYYIKRRISRTTSPRRLFSFCPRSVWSVLRRSNRLLRLLSQDPVPLPSTFSLSPEDKRPEGF